MICFSLSIGKLVDPAASCNLCLCTAPNMVSYIISDTMRNVNMASTEFAVSILIHFELGIAGNAISFFCGTSHYQLLHSNRYTLFDTNDRRHYHLTFFTCQPFTSQPFIIIYPLRLPNYSNRFSYTVQT